MTRKRRWLQRFVALNLLWLGGCSLLEDYRIGVPYRRQEQSNYCVPASVLMWRLYDRLPEISQTSIFNWLGGSACTADEVPGAVNHFTNTFDTYLDVVLSPSQTETEELTARQVVSLDSRVPVIAIVGTARNHVGVINGGKYKKQGDYYQWEFVYFQDPRPFGEDSYYGARQWLDFFCGAGFSHCGQVVSSAAVTGWEYQYLKYGNYVLIYGSAEPCPPRGCGLYEN